MQLWYVPLAMLLVESAVLFLRSDQPKFKANLIIFRPGNHLLLSSYCFFLAFGIGCSITYRALEERFGVLCPILWALVGLALVYYWVLVHFSLMTLRPGTGEFFDRRGFSSMSWRLGDIVGVEVDRSDADPGVIVKVMKDRKNRSWFSIDFYYGASILLEYLAREKGFKLSPEELSITALASDFKRTHLVECWIIAGINAGLGWYLVARTWPS